MIEHSKSIPVFSGNSGKNLLYNYIVERIDQYRKQQEVTARGCLFCISANHKQKDGRIGIYLFYRENQPSQPFHGPVAQLVAHLAVNSKRAGSSPAGPAIFFSPNVQAKLK